MVDLWPSGVAAIVLVAAMLAVGLWRARERRRDAEATLAAIRAMEPFVPGLRVVVSQFLPRGTVVRAGGEILVSPADWRRLQRLAAATFRRR